MKILGKHTTLKQFICDAFEYLLTDHLFRFLGILTYPLIKSSKKTESKNERNILIVCDRSLQAEYLAETIDLIKTDDRLKIRLLDFFRFDRKNGKNFILNKLPYKKISILKAFIYKWDLIITSSGWQRHLVTNERCKTLWIRHGIESGKRNLSRFTNKVCSKRKDNDCFTYSNYVYRNLRRGAMRFDCIFSSSDWNKTAAIQIDPQFDEVIKVVGLLQNDKMLDKYNHRSRLRHKIGLTTDKPAVFILSTWGPYCLFNMHGDKFLKKINSLTSEYDFILNIHPREHRPQPKNKRVWGNYLRTQKKEGILFREPEDDWVEYMIVADIVISDFTSLCLNTALLKKPIIFVPFPENVVVKNCLITELKTIAPTLKPDFSDLKEKLEGSLHNYPLDKLEEFSKKVNSCPGQASELMKKEIYKLLELPQP
ncbi:MAG: CDP-glycerol glycerophosphotransferase family protein [Candidatus Omnitrophota bacterium]